MSVLLGILADAHIAEQANRTNYLTLWKRQMWQNIDARTQGEKLTVYRPASHDRRALLAATEFIRSVHEDLDLLILLGDLATTGQTHDILAAQRVFVEPSISRHIDGKLNAGMGGLGIPLHIVPGNHDRYKDDFGTPGGKLFDAAFEAYYQPKRSVCLETVKRGDVTLGIVSADFCYNENEPVGRLKKLGMGRASPVVLAELDRQTSRWKDQHPGKPVVWAIHFSPSESVDNTLRLENRSEVIELAKNLGVRHIFCGHTHERRHEKGSHPHLYNAGSVSSVECKFNHFLHLCQVTKNGREFELEFKDYIFDETTDEFVESAPSMKA